jgi:hypothetical protein
MHKDFNKNAGNGHQVVAMVADLRKQVYGHLAKADKTLQENSEGGGDSLLGNMLLSAIFWGACFHFMQAGIEAHAPNSGLAHALTEPMVSSGIDGLALAFEGSKEDIRKVDGYPMGRRKADPIFGRPLQRKFNMLSSNDNKAQKARAAKGDIARMWEMLDVLDRLDAQNVTAVRIDADAPLYDTLRDLDIATRKGAATGRVMAPVRRAA